MKTKQPNTITKAARTTIGITSTVVRITAGVLAGAIVGYFVLKTNGVKWQRKQIQKKRSGN